MDLTNYRVENEIGEREKKTTIIIHSIYIHFIVSFLYLKIPENFKERRSNIKDIIYIEKNYPASKITIILHIYAYLFNVLLTRLWR